MLRVVKPLNNLNKMGKLTKNRKLSEAKIDNTKLYNLDEACSLIKDITTTKFDASVDLAVRLGVDPKKANEMVRGVVSLPNGTGKDMKVLALVSPDKEDEAKNAGADYVGLDEYVEKIKGGWTDVDVIVTMPSVMGKLGPLGRILGPRGLMPNPKVGTVTMDVGKAIAAEKKGKCSYRIDKAGIVHAPIGKKSMGEAALKENFNALMSAIIKAKPATSKGIYLRNLSISSTMGAGLRLDVNKVQGDIA